MSIFIENEFIEDEFFYDVWDKAGARLLHSPAWGEAASRLWEVALEKTRRGLDGEREWEALGALVRLAARRFEDDLMAEHSAATAQTCAERATAGLEPASPRR
jgi:hypothetical protein